jgi:hypothetical protein
MQEAALLQASSYPLVCQLLLHLLQLLCQLLLNALDLLTQLPLLPICYKQRICLQLSGARF